jgi:hypothetical protein
LTVPVVLNLIKARSVIDVGCGIGTWASVFQSHGVEAYGVDGDYVNRSQLLISSSRFTPSDLSKSVEISTEWPQHYDLAISLEVAEHLPESSARNFIKSLTAMADIVLFAAAIPFQGGTNHINEQWQTYWAKIFGEFGYKPVDIIRPIIWGNPEVAYVYAQNTILYVNQNALNDYPEFAPYVRESDSAMLSVVHPHKWGKTADVKRLSARTLARQLATVIYSRFVSKR